MKIRVSPYTRVTPKGKKVKVSGHTRTYPKKINRKVGNPTDNLEDYNTFWIKDKSGQFIGRKKVKGKGDTTKTRRSKGKVIFGREKAE